MFGFCKEVGILDENGEVIVEFMLNEVEFVLVNYCN